MEKDFFKALEEHTKSDREYQQADIEERRKIAERMDGLATKEDVKEVLEFMKQLNVGIGIFRFTWNNASKIGSFVLFIVGIWVFIKYGLVGGAIWISRNIGL